MKNLRTLLALLGLCALVTPSIALAQKASGPKAKLMEKYDANKNGKLDADEIAALRKDFAADTKGALARFDTDHDGKLSDDEVAKMTPGSGNKAGGGKKKAEAEKPATDEKKADEKK